MNEKENEYREIFLAEALDNYEEINRLLTQLEKNGTNKNTIHALFRITHTLKGNAAGMGYTPIAEMAHVLEDLFGEVREGRVEITPELFTSIFKAADILGHLIGSIKDNKEVKYKGIKTKLEVLIRKSKETNLVGTTSDIQQDDLPLQESAQPELTETTTIPEEADNKIAFSDLVQVPVRKLDNLLNLVGELIIEKDRILASYQGKGMSASNEYARLSRISSDLQYSVMDVRLVQVGFLFNKFHRVVRDAAVLEGKDVALKVEGADTEIDRNILQVISDSLIHLIRNCVGHGIETPAERQAAGKPSTGTITLSARNEQDAVLIEISDDGKGLDYERIKAKAIQKNLLTEEDAKNATKEDLSMIIFEPGFSTMENVTAIAGRGVGMDVVKKTLESISGTIRLLSNEGKGTVFQLTLPASMAVKSSLLFELNKEVYAIPLAYTESVISLYKSNIFKAGGGLVGTYLGKTISIVFLRDVLDNPGERSDTNKGINQLQNSFSNLHDEQKLEIVVVSFNNRTVGFVVDKLLQQKEIVEKPLMKPVEKIKFVSGFTILGSGNVCLVLNVPYLLGYIFSLTGTHKGNKNFAIS